MIDKAISYDFTVAENGFLVQRYDDKTDTVLSWVFSTAAQVADFIDGAMVALDAGAFGDEEPDPADADIDWR